MTKFRKIAILVVIVALVAVTLSSCNIKADEVSSVLADAVKATKEGGIDIKFEVKDSNLVLYTEKQWNKYYVEANESKNPPYCYSDNAEENKMKGINRTNWDDGDSTEWITDLYKYNLTYNGGYGGQATVTSPKTRNPLTGFIDGDDEDVTVPYGDLSYLESVFTRSLAATETTSLKYTGLKRGAKRIIRVETESILMSDGSYALCKEDGTFVKADGTVVKKGTDDYVWNTGIDTVILDRIDYTLKKGKIESMEVYTEKVGYKDCDQRNYLKSGKIYTVQKAMVVGRQQAIINF